MPDKISPSQFAKSVKEKYPEYKSYDDVKLSQAIIDKYPEYKDVVDFGVQPSIQEPVQPIIPSSKYQKSVDDDRSEIGKTIATLYNGIVGSLERFAGGGAEMFAKAAASIPTPQYNVSGGYMPETKKPVGIAELPKEQQIEARKQLRAKVEKTFEPLKSRYVSKEEEKAIQGKFDVTNGIGLDDLQGLVAMSGGMAVDMGLGGLTGGASFVVQGYDDAVKDYDEAAKKMGVQENDNARMLYGIAGGTINGLLEKFAIDKLVGSGPVFKSIQKKAIANVLKNTANVTGKRAVDAIEEAAQAEIKKLTSDLRSKGARAGYRALVEGGTEMGQAALEDGAKFAINNVQGNEVFNEQEIKDGFFKNLINSGVAGAIYGPIMGYGADKVFGRNINTEVLQDVANAKTDEDLAVINDELSKTFDDNNFSEAERQSVLDNAKRYNQIKQTLPVGTSPAVQVVAIPLIENRIKIDDEINKRKQELEKIDESLRPDEMASISLLEDKRAQINDDIKETVSGDSFNYFEKNGKFFKQLGENTPEEISKNRYDLQLLKQEDNATTTGQGPIQEGATEGDISQRTGIESQQEQEAAKADIGYSYIVSEEGEEVPVAALVNKKVRVNGKPAILYREGQRIVARVIGTNQILDTFGNVNEMMSAAPSDFGIEVDDTIVTETPTGYKVEGQDMVNDNENPIDAISTDPSGNVMNVTLKTPAGKRRKFRGQAAQDLAYQITLKETLKNEDEFESFLEKEYQEELDAAEAKATAEAETARANEQVPIGKITTEPAIGRFTADNINDVDNIPGNKIQKKVINDIKNIVNALKGLLPISVNLHNNNSFGDVMVETGETKEDAMQTRGFYMGLDGSIHLNMDMIATDTMLHEGFHPILDLLEKNNPEVINQFFAELESIPEAASIIASAKENYTGDITQKKEAITDFVAGVADGRVVLNPTNFQKIKAFIVNMLNKIGIGQNQVLMNVQNEQDLIKLAKFVTEKFTTGEQVTKQELGIAEEITDKEGEQKTQFQKKAQIGVEKQSGTTQVATTVGSYKKAGQIAKELGANTVLDYGAGLGLGTDEMSKVISSVDSFEPNAERWQGKSSVTYNNTSDINKKYDAVVNLNVLNVVPKDIRDAIVLDIFDKLNVGGNAIISTRKWSGDVNAAKNYVKGPEGKSIIIKRKSGGKEIDVYQKGFDGNELVDYIKSIVGDAAEVTKNNTFGASGVIVNKKNTILEPQFQKAPTKPVTKKRFGPTIKTFKEQFRYGLLGKEEVKLKEKMSGELSAELSKAERLVKDASDTIKKYGKSVSQQDVVDFMTGKPVSENIPLDLADKLTEMRSHIDMMTDRLIQLGVIDNPESIAYYKENKGKYILRSYESINYKDGFLSKNIYGEGLNIDNVAKKLSNVDKTVVDSALKFLSERAKASYAVETAIDEGAIKIIELNKDNYQVILTSNNKELAVVPKISNQTKNKNVIQYMSEMLILPKNIVEYNDIKSAISNKELSNEDALQKAREDANSILSSSESYVMQKGLTGSVNIKSLSQKKDLSPEIRALMGEYTDPLYNYYSTIFKISSLNASRQYINSLKEYGLGKFFFDKKTEDATEQMAGEESKTLAPLNGLYTFPEIKEALQTSQKEENTFRSAFLGRIRKFKTVYNPATHVKNLIGNMGFAISNGHWNYMGDSYKYIKAQITGASDKDTIRMMDTLNRYGVLNNVVGLGELKTYFEKHESVDDFLEAIYNNANKNTTAAKLGKLKANLNIIPKSIEKAYAIEDDIFKILGFVNEANRYAVAMYSKKYNKLTENEKQKIDGIVAEIVKDTYPTFSRVPKVVKTISKAMFIGNFLAFPVESVRVQYNSLALAKKEIQSGNKKLKIIGATRLSGFVLYNFLFSSLVYYGYNVAKAGLTGIAGIISGDDKDKDEKTQSISRYLASYLKNTDVYISQFSNGKLIYYDIGSLDSYSYQKKVWNSFWSTADKEGFYKSIAPTIATVLDPWMQFDFAVDNIIKLSKNDNGQGFKIYNPEAKPMDIYKDIASFVGKQFLPGAVGSAIKIVDSYQQGDYEKMKDEFQSQIFARKYSVDLKKQFASYVYAESGNQNKEIGFKDRLSDAQKIYTDAKRKNKTGVELAEKYRESIDAYKNVLQTARDYYLSAINGGASIKELNKILTKSRIGPSESRTIRTGHFSSFERGYVRP